MASTAVTRHVVAVPYPGRGHINPMLAVCRLLVAADGALAVTFVVTEEWHALLASARVPSTLPDRVRFATIPNVIPSERGRGADHAGFIEAVNYKMAEPVERLLDRLALERRPEAIVADTFLTWGVAAGARLGIPVCSLWTQPATFFLALYHFDLWPPVDGRDREEVRGVKYVCQDEPESPPHEEPKQELPDEKDDNFEDTIRSRQLGRYPHSVAYRVWHIDGPPLRCFPLQVYSRWATDESDQRLEHFIAGLASSSVRLSDLKPLIHNERTVKHLLAAVSSIRKAQCLLFTTMFELEACVIESLRSALPCPVYPIGPCVPYMTLDEQPSKSNGEVISPEDYFTWLDSQPVNSVLYVSLGSFLSVSASQLDEIALGLAASGVRFLWILREQSPRVRELVGVTERGMVMPWCDQFKVLCHPSVGGFLTHCGMNSTLEAVFTGVPLLALPLLFDQPIDGRLIVEDWKIGLRLRDWSDKDRLIGSEEIARAIKRLMACDEAETKAIRRRALDGKRFLEEQSTRVDPHITIAVH